MNKFFVFFLALTFPYLLLSCTGNQSKSKVAVTKYKKWQTGKVYAHIKVQNDTALSYALYLPKSYDETKKNLVVFIFDAHARGILPVKKYQTLAEKYNLILAASNNSQNGQNASERNRIITGFMGDVEKQLNIDKKRIYTAGFSGGARIATLVALYNNNVMGTIGCSAGFPQVQNLVNKSFKWVGVVGNKDFNYLELKNLNRQLKANHWNSHLLVFDGKHEWPPTEVVDEAFHILFSKAKVNLKFTDKINNPALEKREVQQQRMLARAMEEKDAKWWNTKIAELETKTEHSKSGEEKLMNIRLINYLSMISYIYTDRALKAHQPETAAKYLTTYQKVDPDNPDVYFFKAVRFAMLKQDQKALESLRKANELGFTETSKIKQYKALDRLKSDAEFKEIF